MSMTNVRVGVAIWSRASGVSSSSSRRKRCRGRHSASTPIGCDSGIAASMPAPSCERLLASSTSKHGDVGGGAYPTVVPVFVGDGGGTDSGTGAAGIGAAGTGAAVSRFASRAGDAGSRISRLLATRSGPVRRGLSCARPVALMMAPGLSARVSFLAAFDPSLP
eukprot:scaffold116830_cov64-Phaeocystis_antarctica.AAC.1